MDLTVKIFFMLSLAFQLLNASVFNTNIDPPSPTDPALSARYIIHTVDWVTVSTISTEKEIKGFPLGNIKSMADGPISNGTGVPYFYITPLDITGLDLEADNRCTIMATLAETGFCSGKEYDVQDPRCGRVIISGHMLKLGNTTEEFKFAKGALFERHPAMAEWPTIHGFYITKVNIENVMILDYIGRGMEHVPVQDYLNANGMQNYQNDELNKL